MAGRWPFRKLLPLVMTSVQLVLLALSLANQWHLPTSPAELHRRYPPTVPRTASDEGETVSFSPEPREMKTSTLFKVATALSLPAMFCGVMIGLPLVLLGIGGGEAWRIGLSALVGIVMWRQIGRWVDEQRAMSSGIVPFRTRARFALQWILRLLAFCLLGLFILNVAFERRHLTTEAAFLSWTWIVWNCVYLSLSFWGERRESKLARPNTSAVDKA
jgi:hypothetical protein